MAKCRTGGVGALAFSTLLALGCGAGGSHAGPDGGGAAGNGGAATGAGSIEVHKFALGARVHAVTRAYFAGANGDSSYLMAVATEDPDVPIKLLAFDLEEATWTKMFEVAAGGALPKGPHRIDALTSFIDGGYGPALIFGARTLPGLVNEGLFVARWSPGHYDVTRVSATDLPGLTFLSISEGLTHAMVASCASSGATKVAAMLLQNTDGAISLLGTLAGDVVADVGASPLDGAPVVAKAGGAYDAPYAFVAPMRKADGGTARITPFTMNNGFALAEAVAVPIPAGVTLSRETPGAPILFAGSDGLLYHLDVESKLADTTLVAGPEHLRPGSSMALAKIAGDPYIDLVQGSVGDSIGLDLMYGKDVPFQLFGQPKSGKTFIPTGPAILPLWPTGFGPNPSLFAVGRGASGAFDTAMMVVANTLTPENPAKVLVDETAAPDGGVVPLEDGTDPCFIEFPPRPLASYECALPEPCPLVGGTDASWTPVPPPISIDADAAKCALRTIRDDVPAHLRLSMSNLEGADVEDIWVQGDGSAVVWRHGMLDLGGWVFEPRRFPRKDKAFFDACLAESSAKALYHCLYEWWVEDGCYAAGDLPCSAK